MNVLVTGILGCIGASLAEWLTSQRDVRVIGFDTADGRARMQQVLGADLCAKIEVIQGDVCDEEALLAAIKANGVTSIIHLAGLQVPTCRANPLLGAAVNVSGTLAVYQAAVRSGSVSRIVQASSAAVYGPPTFYAPNEPITEFSLVQPSELYGVWKVAGEELARVYFAKSGISTVALRPWTVYGLGRDFGMTSEPTKAIKCVAAGRPANISFGGQCDFNLVSDVGAAFGVCALDEWTGGSQVLNVPGTTCTIAEFCEVLRTAAAEEGLGEHCVITCGNAQLPIAYGLSSDRIKALFPRVPSTALKDGVRLTLRRMMQLHASGALDVADIS